MTPLDREIHHTALVIAWCVGAVWVALVIAIAAANIRWQAARRTENGVHVWHCRRCGQRFSTLTYLQDHDLLDHTILHK